MKRVLAWAIVFVAPVFSFAQEPIKVYFSAKVKSTKQKEINKRLEARFFSTKNSEVFLPQEHLKYQLEAHGNDQYASYSMDKNAINWCDILFLVSPYGKDCSWAVGYAQAINKFTVVYLTEKESINDLLVINSADIIATDNKEVYKQLLGNPSLAKKSLFIFENNNFEETLICMFYANKSKQARIKQNSEQFQAMQADAKKKKVH